MSSRCVCLWSVPRTFWPLTLYPSDLYLFSIEVRLVIVCTNDSKSHNYKSGTAMFKSSWEHRNQFMMVVLFWLYTLNCLHRTDTVVELVHDKRTRVINSTPAGVTFRVKEEKQKWPCRSVPQTWLHSVSTAWIHTWSSRFKVQFFFTFGLNYCLCASLWRVLKLSKVWL